MPKFRFIFIRVTLISLLLIVKEIVSKESDDTSAIRKKLVLNPCSPTNLKFTDNKWSIGINRHCGTSLKIREVKGCSYDTVNGYFEPYGTSLGVTKYEKFLSNGTIFRLLKHEKLGKWVIERSDLIVMYISSSFGNEPPQTGWITVYGAGPAPTVIYHKLGKSKIATQQFSSNKFKSELAVDEMDLRVSENRRVLQSMLHPATGKELGLSLRDTYKAGYPFESIVIDNLLDKKLLKKALLFRDVPMSQWVGPETGPGCCKDKYRLNFNYWDGNKYARALHSMLVDPAYIAFLEAMTGIRNILPMRISNDVMSQLGSNIIAVGRGGHLQVHNDVRHCTHKLFVRYS